MLTDLFKAFDYIKSSHKSDFFSPKMPIALCTCATCSEIPVASCVCKSEIIEYHRYRMPFAVVGKDRSVYICQTIKQIKNEVQTFEFFFTIAFI